MSSLTIKTSHSTGLGLLPQVRTGIHTLTTRVWTFSHFIVEIHGAFGEEASKFCEPLHKKRREKICRRQFYDPGSQNDPLTITNLARTTKMERKHDARPNSIRGIFKCPKCYWSVNCSLQEESQKTLRTFHWDLQLKRAVLKITAVLYQLVVEIRIIWIH